MTSPSTVSTDTSFFGHPRGLATLFFTEMWERWGYYGMRALLILFMTATVANGGLGFSIARASAVYGLFAAGVYLSALPGGWVADRILGQRKAVLCGGTILIAGYFLIAAPSIGAFYAGLLLVVIGTGLLKPNASTIVGQLYGPDDPRRDSGYSIFYMGINLGALLAPLACGWVATTYGWRWGMSIAGIGMTLGLVQYMAGAGRLGTAGLHPVPAAPGAAHPRGALMKAVAGVAAVGLAVFAADATGLISIQPEDLSAAAGTLLTLVVIALFGWMLFAADWTPAERKRIIAIAVLFVAASIFWSVFEQAGSTLNLFADRATNNSVFGYQFPSSWFQSVQPLGIVILAPVFAWIWLSLGPRDPSSTTKFSLALIAVGASFLILVPASLAAAGGSKVSPLWLTTTYTLHAVGEMLLGPVGLSVFNKLAPARVAGFMMGVWFLSISLGNFIGARVSSVYEQFPLEQLFGYVGGFAVLAGIVLVFLIRPVGRLTGGSN
jgi:proton-dependent oligopeptide transporter, POT family